MNASDDHGQARESQTLRLPAARLDRLEPWAAGRGLAVAARVRDPSNRVALVRNAWSDGWLPPGGAVESDETLRAAAAREVHEETGLAAAVGDPLVVIDQSYVDRATGRERFTATFHLFDATADGTIPSADRLGVSADEIRAARWFDTLPDRLHDDALLRPYAAVDG